MVHKAIRTFESWKHSLNTIFELGLLGGFALLPSRRLLLLRWTLDQK